MCVCVLRPISKGILSHHVPLNKGTGVQGLCSGESVNVSVSFRLVTLPFSDIEQLSLAVCRLLPLPL